MSTASAATAAPAPSAAEQIAAARAGGEGAFLALAGPLRRELQAHCYRMVGSLHDAEDLVQETLLRAWRSIDRFEGRASLRGWLYRIATNACFDHLESRSRRQLLPERPPADPRAPLEPAIEGMLWVEPYPDSALGEPPLGPEAQVSLRQSVQLAFLAALQWLPPKQRAVLILREVMGWPAAEVAEMLDLSVPAVNSALQRARETLESRGISRGEAPLRADEAAEEKPEVLKLLGRYVRAWEDGDVGALVSLLREDAAFAMPPFLTWFRGREAIRAFVAGALLAGDARGRYRMVLTRANGAPAVATYELDPASGAYRPRAVQVVEVAGDQVVAIHSFLDPSLPERFGLPAQM
ncbi:MAG TPA: sigma-70 family RNA polymerase sigma factor [Myxococcales bacterium]|jgi:RNA polymerase sigma-70 factor (ECF subfamily)|nr:sigma-70 family RNA polymerase sigma factor [Myxococcales bacterium]